MELQKEEEIVQTIDLDVSTSAIDQIVDFWEVNSGSSDIGAAFAIYARVKENIISIKLAIILYFYHQQLSQDGAPLKSTEGLNVTAIISKSNQDPDIEQVWSIPLLDDGSASPDIEFNDGIFSGAFVPYDLSKPPQEYNGAYKIFVTVKFQDVVISSDLEKDVEFTNFHLFLVWILLKRIVDNLIFVKCCLLFFHSQLQPG